MLDFDRIRSPRDFEDRHVSSDRFEMVGKPLGVDCGGSDDHLQVAAASCQSVQIPQQKIDIQRSLMSFINNDCVVLIEPSVMLGFCEQNSICHQLDVRLRRRRIGKSDLEPDLTTNRHAEFVCDTSCDGPSGDPSRLRVTDQSFNATPKFQTDLGKLRRFPGACFSTKHDHLVIADDLGDFFAPLTDGEFVVIFRFRTTFPSLVSNSTRAIKGRLKFLQVLVKWTTISLGIQNSLPLTAQAMAIHQQSAGECLFYLCRLRHEFRSYTAKRRPFAALAVLLCDRIAFRCRSATCIVR